MTGEMQFPCGYKGEKQESVMKDYWLKFTDGKQRELLKAVIKQEFKTQIAFAKFLGVSRISVQNWQCEKNRLPKRVFEQICEAFPEYKEFAIFISGELHSKDCIKKAQTRYLQKMNSIHDKMNASLAACNTDELKICIDSLTKNRKIKGTSQKQIEMDNLKKVCFDTSAVDFSWKDLVKGIALPKELSFDLCYVVGAHIGDGSMNIYRRKNQVDYYYHCCGHQINDKEWYDNILVPLYKNLFKLELASKKCSDGTCTIQFRSKAVVSFYHNCLGLPLGKKCDIIDIPKIILDAGLPYALTCVSGIFDTDFSISFKNKNNTVHAYPLIELRVRSEKLIKTISRILDNIGISNFTRKSNYFDKRVGKQIEMHSVTVSGRNNVNRWFEMIGSRNPNYLSKYQIWKKFGFCPPRLNYYQRKEILEGFKNPLEYYVQQSTQKNGNGEIRTPDLPVISRLLQPG